MNVAAVFPLVRTRAFAAPFDYLVPRELAQRVVRGSMVVVPLGAQTVLGVVLAITSSSRHEGKLLAIRQVADLAPVPDDLLDLAQLVSDHYVAPLGAALALVTPPLGAVKIERAFALTAAGEAAISAGESGLHEFVDAAHGPHDAAAARRYRRRRWIVPSYSLRVVGERALRRVRRGPGMPARLGPRQRAALHLLDERGVLAERELMASTGLSRGALTSMVASAAIEVADEPSVPGEAPQTTDWQACATDAAPGLLPAQRAALAAVTAALGTGEEVLIHGVTGSGKTEVYLRAAHEVLCRGGTVLVLVPEIGLTGQTVTRIAARFADVPLSVVHSGLSAGERLDAYRAAASGAARIVIGARSAIFTPLPGLGLIVIDEEHDGSYKQENEPRYDARTVARWRAAQTGAALVLGTATPSVEAFARVRRHVDLPRRVDGSQPPRLEIVDMRDVHGVLSQTLSEALTTAVDAQDKAILFLNRRGFASSLACGHCGHSWECPRCDVTLTLFGGGRGLRCRTCGFSEPAPGTCPRCGSVDVIRYGFGTERVEREVASLLPGVELLRLDSDVASSYARLRAVLDRFAAPGARILVGTQMIAKGHHFPDVTLVGVVNADLMLHLPDFRAEERTFAMLVQVGGRSGRGAHRGRVIVQALDPEARPIALAAAAEGERFYREELVRRDALGYPPATTLVALELSSLSPDKTAKGAQFIADKLVVGLTHGEQVVGPGPLWKERGRSAARVLIKSMQAGETQRQLKAFVERYGARFAERGARLVVDVEPQWL